MQNDFHVYGSDKTIEGIDLSEISGRGKRGARSGPGLRARAGEHGVHARAAGRWHTRYLRRRRDAEGLRRSNSIPASARS